MTTPILTKRQQRHSLSAKKTSVKGLRNVLAQPHDNFWPLISSNNCTTVEDSLKELIPAIKRPSLTIPWSRLKRMKKQERALAKNEALLSEETSVDKNILNSIIVGINAVTRSLERNNVCCILLDANIEPPFLVKHIILMAQNKNIPILLLPSLKSITLNTIGFSSAALALKNIVNETPDHYFYKLYKIVIEIFEQIFVPKNPVQLFKDNESIDDSLTCDQNELMESESKMSVSKSEEFTLSTNIYKYRTSIKTRAFIPPSVTENTLTEKAESNDFIAVTNYNSDSDSNENAVKPVKNSRYVNIHKNTVKDARKSFNHNKKSGNKAESVKYLPLKVKRLQGNTNRVKATKASKQKKK